MVESNKDRPIDNLSAQLLAIYKDTDCNGCTLSTCSSCLNRIRQGLEYLCLYTCKQYEIPLEKENKKGEMIAIQHPTLADLTPLIEKHFKRNDMIWSKEIGIHMGSIWITGNLGSHAQQELIEGDTGIKKETITNARNSMFIVTDWFYKQFGEESPLPATGVQSPVVGVSLDKDRVNELLERITSIEDHRMKTPGEGSRVSEEGFDEIFWDDLIESIGSDSCVLFIGQDIASNEKNESIHELFYSTTSGKNIAYNVDDGFFLPGAEKQLKIKALNFYSREFNTQNQNGDRVLKKILQLPLSLIVSVSPDDSVHRILTEYEIDHQFLFYNGQKQDCNEPSPENPVVFNLLGNSSANGSYIYTHEQYYNYLKEQREVKLPTEIESKIQEAAHYLFIGIDFNKWYNRLLMFNLNLDAEGYALNTKHIGELNYLFVNKQFDTTYINADYEEFSDILIHKCQEAGYFEDLVDSFIRSIKSKLQRLLDDPAAESDVDLDQIEAKIESILV